MEGIDDPVEAMAARGRAYVRFGVEHPEHYRIMFMGAGLRPRRSSGTTCSRTGSFAHLVEGIQRVIDAGRDGPRHRRLHDGAARLGQHPRPHVAPRRPARRCPWPELEPFVDEHLAMCMNGTILGDRLPVTAGAPSRRKK